MSERFIKIFLVLVIALSAGYAQADIASDIQAGISVEQVIENALADGLSAPKIVKKLIAADVNPVRAAELVTTAKPNEAARIAKAAAKKAPEAALDIAGTVAQVAPEEAAKVAGKVTQVVPESASDIASTVTQVVPEAAADIVTTVAKAASKAEAEKPSEKTPPVEPVENEPTSEEQCYEKRGWCSVPTKCPPVSPDVPDRKCTKLVECIKRICY
ncbi:MAG: hypothetical protein ABFS56_14395 [Pseudomonadota bacterium]